MLMGGIIVHNEMEVKVFWGAFSLVSEVMSVCRVAVGIEIDFIGRFYTP